MLCADVNHILWPLEWCDRRHSPSPLSNRRCSSGLSWKNILPRNLYVKLSFNCFPRIRRSKSISLWLFLSHLNHEALVGIRHRNSGHILFYSSWFCKRFDLLPFHPSLNRWNHRAADSRHIVQECPRGSQECSGECSVLQQQGCIVLHEVILSVESGYAHALTSICLHIFAACGSMYARLWPFKCVTRRGEPDKIGFNSFNRSWSFLRVHDILSSQTEIKSEYWFNHWYLQ